MGIPKFFRYISERYPMTSQLIQENKIPEFDNLYVDFNGIIHNCSHPNDGDAHFRLSEEQIFTAIFSYVDLLFGKIKPKKLFFMAVDGVAPRAKMNQQRSRRFRTAKEAREVREKAERKGEKLPDEKAFDSNCITPGTDFMAKLSSQLRYFVNKKITEDSNWRDVTVVLSGHEVPGEGEHKIMEYIRLAKAQPDYDPNVRHCLYGLDADLIMLGLLSHDPHFCLLREEVKFGPASRKKQNTSLEAINFYLLHLSLMREYLNLEFVDIENSLPFEHNLERIIDDFILLAVFVGNDFLPNLPDLHIHENGLERLFDVYKRVLPRMGGYLNESGKIDTKRLQVVLDEMKIWETEVFQREYADLNWYKGKQEKYVKEMETARLRNQLVLTAPQKIIFNEVKELILSNREARSAKLRNAPSKLTMPNTFSARERKFIGNLADELNLQISWDEFDDEDQNLVTWRIPGAPDHDPPEQVEDANGEDGNDDQWEDVDSEGEQESNAAVDRILAKYEKAPVKEDDAEDFDTRHERAIQEKMNDWKGRYYQEKLEISFDDPQAMGDLVYRYVEGLQWVMYYYYSGVASWSWFYNYHYAPRISDLKGVDQMSFAFDLGTPFRPFEQLMGVLPEASKELIPQAFRDLMYDMNSPILDFYPREFEQDLNGKKAEWEAIVKIPFIDEKRLLKAMGSREHRLSEEERSRNSFGTSTRFYYQPGEPTFYASSLPRFFPDLPRCTCAMEPFNLPTLDGLHLVPGLCDGVFLGEKALAGFPSLNTLPHTVSLGYHGVNVHGSESKNKSMIVHIRNPYEGNKTEQIAKEMVGQRVFVHWPFIHEAKVAAVSDYLFKFEKVAVGKGDQFRILSNPHSPQGVQHWKGKAERIENHYSKRFGVITGTVEHLLHVRPLKGLKRLDTGAFVKDYEGEDKEFEQAVQMILSEVHSEDPRYIEKEALPLKEEFPGGSKVFFLGDHAYGTAAQVSDTTEDSVSVILAFFPGERQELQKFKEVVNNRVSMTYFPSFEVARMLSMSAHELSRITSSFMVHDSDGQKVNLGLSLKFEAKGLKVVGYSRKEERYWEYSDKAVKLLREYKAKYPEIFRHLGGDFPKSSQVFPNENADAKLKEVKKWLNSQGVRDFEAVSLFCDQLEKENITQIVQFADELRANKSAENIKKALVKGIPRRALLKPAHAVFRLQKQSFGLCDRVIMVQDSGSVPLALKGVVVALNNKDMDVVWDSAFMAGTTLSDRCPPYRGLTVEFNSCLNLTNPQFVVTTNPDVPPLPPVVSQPQRFGPLKPAIPSSGFQGRGQANTFRGGPPRGGAAMRIMTNPNRGRGGSRFGNGSPWTNGTAQQASTNSQADAPASTSDTSNQPVTPAQSTNGNANVDSTPPKPRPATDGSPNAFQNTPPSRGRGGYRGGPPGGQTLFNPNGSPPNHVANSRGSGFRGRGGFSDRGRGSPGRGFSPMGRGRGRGSGGPGYSSPQNAAPVSSST